MFRVKINLLFNAYPFNYMNFVTCRKSRTRDLERRVMRSHVVLCPVPLELVVSEEFERIFGSFSNKTTVFKKDIAIPFIVI
jgi:hypothetical protein